MKTENIGYYVQIIGKLPRKRKAQRFETRVESMDLMQAKIAALDLIGKYKIKGVEKAHIAPWSISENDFVDSNGQKQTMVMRSIFPCGESMAVEL